MVNTLRNFQECNFSYQQLSYILTADSSKYVIYLPNHTWLDSTLLEAVVITLFQLIRIEDLAPPHRAQGRS